MADMTFNNGVSAKTDMCIAAGGRLTFTLYGMTISDAVKIVDDPENVREILSNNLTYEGYTDLLCIAKEGDHLRATLGKADE